MALAEVEKPTESTAPVFTHRQILIVLSGLLLGMLLAALDQTIVATAMKTIADQLEGQTAQAWVTTAYLITATISTPLYGKLSDIYGRKRFYLFAIAIFIVGSILCGWANSIYELAAFRAVQGIGAGGLMSLAFAIISDMVAVRERARYQGYFMMVFGSSSVLGPVLGGFFAGQSALWGIDGWRWIFYVNIPIGIAAFLVVLSKLNLPHTRLDHRIDFGGAILLAVAIVPSLVIAEQGNSWGWASNRAILCYSISLVGLVLFLIVEKIMKDEAILPLWMFRRGVFAMNSAISFIVGVGMFGGMVLIPLYLQIVRGISPTKSGLLLMPLMVGIIIFSGISGQMLAKTGRYKIFPILGVALMISALLLFSTLNYDTSLWKASIYMVIMGAGLGCCVQTLVIASQNSLPPQNMGVATSSATFFRSMGGTFGAAGLLSILFSTVGPNIKDQYQSVMTNNPLGLRQALLQLDPSTQLLLKNSSAGDHSALDDTSFIQHLPGVLKNIFLVGFADSISVAFLVAAALLVPALILSLIVKETSIDSKSGLAARHDDENAQKLAAAGPSPE